MDPLSITGACISAISSITKLSVQINGFVSGVREARRDMDAVSRELVSLTSCLTALRDDAQKQVSFPATLREVVASCEQIADEMAARLDKLGSRKKGAAAVRWTVGDREHMNKLRSSLESHKSCIDIALEMVSIQILSNIDDNVDEVKAETAAIREDTTEIKQDTKQIASLIQEIGFLRLQVANLKQEKDNVVLQRFLDESTSYAESSVDPQELQSVQTRRRRQQQQQQRGVSPNAANVNESGAYDGMASGSRNSRDDGMSDTDGARSDQDDFATETDTHDTDGDDEDAGGGELQTSASPSFAPVLTQSRLFMRKVGSASRIKEEAEDVYGPFRDPSPSNGKNFASASAPKPFLSPPPPRPERTQFRPPKHPTPPSQAVRPSLPNSTYGPPPRPGRPSSLDLLTLPPLPPPPSQRVRPSPPNSTYGPPPRPRRPSSPDLLISNGTFALGLGTAGLPPPRPPLERNDGTANNYWMMGGKVRSSGPLFGFMRREIESQTGWGGPYTRGEPVYIEAHRHPDGDNDNGYSVLVKALRRVGGGIVVKLDDVEIWDSATGMPVANAREAIRAAGVPSIEDWRRKNARVTDSLISLGEPPADFHVFEPR